MWKGLTFYWSKLLLNFQHSRSMTRWITQCQDYKFLSEYTYCWKFILLRTKKNRLFENTAYKFREGLTENSSSVPITGLVISNNVMKCLKIDYVFMKNTAKISLTLLVFLCPLMFVINFSKFLMPNEFILQEVTKEQYSFEIGIT